MAESYFVQKIWLILITADQKVLSASCEISKQSSICNRGARFGHPMDPVVSVQKQTLLRKLKEACKSFWSPIGSLKSFITIRVQTNSNDFGRFWIYLTESNSNFVVAKILFFWTIRILGVFKVQSHTMWLSMCMCCGLFVPTEFQFECGGVRDDSW